MNCLEAWFLACFYGLIGIQHLCLFLWTGFFICFYEKLGTLIFACFSELTCTGCIAQILSCSYAGNTGTLVCSNWNPASLPDSMDCSESSFFTYYYEKLGTLILCLFLRTARNPDSLPDRLNSVLSLLRTPESFSNLLGTLRLCLFIWTDRNPDSLPAFIKSSKP